ncbi:type II toxin-antitoxin system RelE/ParE family toxin [Thermomonas sp.]|uniref:type II toxin-antitoxin system RelE family toxin n=1 Tax=Thermomonas sp. TaxID=1971895 RepID=UPI00261271B0|nr:type II toxin-antitoxin system RelE/ParE family toxin [Thermomonas sp.]MCO5054667.1 type II toxin-antitoxin system RelE/ParE family toxin [Thermomonas sp.]
MNRIDWTPKAAKQLRKLPKVAQVDIRDAVQGKLPHFPKCGGVKALVNHQYGYRLRVGNYRVLFNFEGTITLVRIEEVGKRDERTY